RFNQPRHQHLQPRARLCRSDTGLRPSDDVQIPGAPRVDPLVVAVHDGLRTERRVDLCMRADVEPEEGRIDDPNDLKLVAVESDGPANDGVTAAVFRLPE